MGLTDSYRMFNPKTMAQLYNLFWVPHGTFSKIDRTISHKTSLNRYKKIKIIPCIPSDQERLRLDFNNTKNNRKPTYT